MNNRLVINSDKTRVLVMASAHKHRKHQNFGIQLNTGNEIITPVDSETLLGAKLSNNFTWNLHVRDDPKSIFRILSTKLRILKKISMISDFKTRAIASSLIISSILCIIPVYGSCRQYLQNMLKVQLNTAAH